MISSTYQTVLVRLTGTLVTSCDLCHDGASCLESRERGDSFPNQACVCKDGFVGDGLTCYDTKLCSDSSCCSRGYHWSPDRGCVDTDECSLPDSPCTSPQVCQNTPGSFICLEPSSRTRVARSSQFAQFSCGHTVCPLGMDCISSNGTLRCADPCENYTVLDDDWRSTNNTSNQILHCDQHIDWQGWYRLLLEQTRSLILFMREVNRTGPAVLPTSPDTTPAYFTTTQAPTDVTSLNVAIRPFLALDGGISSSGAKASASMFLFRNSNYTETYSGGLVTLPVGSPLYVGVSVEERDPSFAVVLEDCYATHSSNPDGATQYPLIQNKCPTDRRQVSVVESGSSLRARFTALFFLLQNEYREVYLHCSLSLCDQRSSSCVPPCTRRNYRSVSNSEPLSALTIGPVIWDKSPE
ncbi:hypothetical protein VZT92_002298 [Zoarces viviparus]|uniref:ZP domain-containing protein n=1 Tax=Zoarces viviparus TaxID=48416 RepID=A0AAW1G0E9_ZOAVI